jgi:hypothetical protein
VTRSTKRLCHDRRRTAPREAVVHQLVNKSATADLRATKMLFDMMKDAEHKSGAASPPPLDAADKEVVQLFIERLRRQILAEIAAQKTETVAAAENPDDG